MHVAKDASSLAGALAAHARIATARASPGVAQIALDTTLYDPVLDMVASLGLAPPRFAPLAAREGHLAQYFAMARGAPGVQALAMSKWCARACG